MRTFHLREQQQLSNTRESHATCGSSARVLICNSVFSKMPRGKRDYRRVLWGQQQPAATLCCRSKVKYQYIDRACCTAATAISPHIRLLTLEGKEQEHLPNFMNSFSISVRDAACTIPLTKSVLVVMVSGWARRPKDQSATAAK